MTRGFDNLLHISVAPYLVANDRKDRPAESSQPGYAVALARWHIRTRDAGAGDSRDGKSVEAARTQSECRLRPGRAVDRRSRQLRSRDH